MPSPPRAEGKPQASRTGRTPDGRPFRAVSLRGTFCLQKPANPV